MKLNEDGNMVKFMSAKWAAQYCKVLNASQAYAKAGETWEGAFIFEAEYEDGTVVRLYMDLWHGKCRGTKEVGPDDTAPFIMSGPYENWKAVAEKELDPIRGLLSGKFKLQGDMAVVMRHTKAAVEMVNCIMGVPNTEL